MTDREADAPSPFAALREHRPDWMAAFSDMFRASYDPPEPALPKRERVLVYLIALASAGAVEGFRAHLRDAEAEGLSRAEILEAILLLVPVAGYPRVLEFVNAMSDYPDDAGDVPDTAGTAPGTS